jgi:hypothetical protein
MAVTCSASISSRADAGSKWPIDTKVPNACIVAAVGWIDAVWDMGQGANTFPVGVTRPDPGHDPVRTCASCPGREWSTSAFLSWGHCPQADQEAR